MSGVAPVGVEAAACYSALRCAEDKGYDRDCVEAIYEAGLRRDMELRFTPEETEAAVARFRELVGSDEIDRLARVVATRKGEE